VTKWIKLANRKNIGRLNFSCDESDCRVGLSQGL
jgi:hypothetical protein